MRRTSRTAPTSRRCACWPRSGRRCSSWPRPARPAHTRTSCRWSTRCSPASTSGPTRSCSPSRRWSWRPTRTRPGLSAVARWRSTSHCRTTRTTCGGSATTTPTSPTAAPTASSTRSWPGATRTRSRHASTRTTPPERTTWPCRWCRPTPRPTRSRWPSGAASPPPSSDPSHRRSGVGGVEDALDRRVEHGVELGVALLGREPLGERTREARDHPVVARQARVGLVTRVAAGERDHLEAARVRDGLRVEAVGLGERELQHHRLTVGQRTELFEDRGLEELLGLRLLGRVDVDLGLDDRDQVVAEDLPADLELLVHDRLHTTRVRELDDRAHLGAEDALAQRALEQVVETRHRLHDLHAVGLVGQALVDLQERDHLLHIPQELRRALALDLAVHGPLEEDGAEDARAVEARAGDDPAPHRVHAVEHLVVAGVLALLDAVELERLRRAPTALVECGDEAGTALDGGEHVLVHGIPRDR